jgi:hypothetical protein
MTPNVVLIQQPSIDFSTFLGLSHQALGRSPARAVDASNRKHSDTERFLSCLASLRDSKATIGLTPNLLTHVSFSVFIAADERDLLGLLEAAAGMPFVQAETNQQYVNIAVVTGTLAQWRDAVKSGSSPNVEPNVRICFNRILGLFEQAGLNVWTDMVKKPLGPTFLLEDKRR